MLRFQRDGFSVEAARKKGRPLPEWYLDEPEVFWDDEVFISAFWLLNTERTSLGMNMGEIPWSKIIKYGQHIGLDTDMLDILVVLIREMDGKYLGWHQSEANKKVRQNSNTQTGTTPA